MVAEDSIFLQALELVWKFPIQSDELGDLFLELHVLCFESQLLFTQFNDALLLICNCFCKLPVSDLDAVVLCEGFV